MSGRVRVAVLSLVALLALAVVVANVTIHPQDGPLALAAVLEPYLLVAGVGSGLLAVASSFGMGRTGAWVRLLAGVVVVAGVVRLGGEWWSPAPTREGDPAAAATLRVLSWNLELGARPAGDGVAGIAEREVDLVALQELTPDVARAIEADPVLAERFPYRILEPRDGVAGMGLLSRRPLVIGSYGTGPVVLRAGLLVADGTRIELFNVHPYPPAVDRAAVLPVGLDVRRRDDDLASIRRSIDALADPATALILGDLNATPFEAGYGVLASGLRDAHAEAGSGPGFTWRPSSLERLGIGLLRMDVVLSGAALRPVAVSEDCSIPGDHCRLYADLEVQAPSGA